MNPIKAISVLSAVIAVASVSVAVLMMREKDVKSIPVVTMSEEVTVTEAEAVTTLTSLSTTTA
ncbi:MAG: hypothetical protein J6B74_01895, partial [Ruminococcus sp.]|nr:hypothetical protein [Ruminococcus sp.]